MKNNNSDYKIQLGKLILQAEHQMTKQLSDFLKDNAKNMSPQGWLVLENLSDGIGMSMTELCRLTHVNDSTLTKIVDKLVKDSLVYRRPDSKDRRKVVIFRSKRGTVLFDKLKAPLAQSYDNLFPDFSDEQAKKLVSQLQHFLSASTDINFS